MIFKDTIDGNYYFLSTFYPCVIQLKLNDQVYMFENAESAFQAQKNLSIAAQFMHTKGLEAKRYGEQLKITTLNWNQYQLFAMAQALNAKFKVSSLLLELKKVEGDILNENYWGDTFWGIYKGKGKNILGKMLMNIRDYNNDLGRLYNYINTELIKEVNDDNK